MPTSQYDQIGKILNAVIFLRPRKVLEIGPGFGKYGVLLREYLEYWGTGKKKTYSQWEVTLDAIEAFEEYLTPIHKFVYNTLYVGEAQRIIPSLKETYDLVLLIDVLEHLSKEEGERLLRLLTEKHKTILVSVPRDIGDQKDSFGNPYETHRSSWRLSEFKHYGYVLSLRDPSSIIAIISKDKKRIRTLRAQLRYRSFAILFSYTPLLTRLLRRALSKRHSLHS